MPIVSISLNDKILEELERLKKESGYSGRSEVIRAGVRSLISENKENAKLSGKIEGVLIIVHGHKQAKESAGIMHEFTDIIKTHMHNSLENNKCLEIFVVSGDAKKVSSFESEFKTDKKMGFVKLIVT